MPQISIRLRVRLDGKEGLVTLSEDGWRGHCLEEKQIYCAAFDRFLCIGLETDSAFLYGENAVIQP